MREKLALYTNLPEARVQVNIFLSERKHFKSNFDQVWFKNRRAKYRKKQKILVDASKTNVSIVNDIQTSEDDNDDEDDNSNPKQDTIIHHEEKTGDLNLFFNFFSFCFLLFFKYR